MLSALSSLYKSLCEANAVYLNPVDGVERPAVKSVPIPAISDEQMERYLEAPDPDIHKAHSRKLKAYRDRAIISVLAFHSLRVSEMTGLQIKSMGEDRGVPIFVVKGKGETVRKLPIRSHTRIRIEEYLKHASHGDDREVILFQSVRIPGRALAQSEVYRHIVRKYALGSCVNPQEVCCHSFRVTGATNAVENNADMKDVQHYLGHGTIAATEGYIRSRPKLEDSPVEKIKY